MTKHIQTTIIILFFTTASYGQNDFEYYDYNNVGFELLGSGPIYTLFYEKAVVLRPWQTINIKPQLEYVWGSDEDSIPSHLIPFFGINYVIGKPKFHFNAGISTAIDFSFGSNKSKVYFFHSISIGPRVMIKEKIIIGINYNYYLRKPEFMDIQSYPNWFGILMAIPI